MAERTSEMVCQSAALNGLTIVLIETDLMQGRQDAIEAMHAILKAFAIQTIRCPRIGAARDRSGGGSPGPVVRRRRTRCSSNSRSGWRYRRRRPGTAPRRV